MAGLSALGLVRGISPFQWPKPALLQSIKLFRDVLISFLKAISDGRYRRVVRYPQWFLLLVAVLGNLSGCRSSRDLEAFARRHRETAGLSTLLGSPGAAGVLQGDLHVRDMVICTDGSGRRLKPHMIVFGVAVMDEEPFKALANGLGLAIGG